MLNQIIDFSLKNRLLVLFLALVLLLGGGYVATQMEVDVFPDLTAPSVVVITEAHGMATEEVERLVTFPIETAVNGAADVRRVRSSSATGISIVWVDFEWDTDIFKARQIVSEKMATVAEQLPENASNPVLAPQSSIIGEIMVLTVSSDSISPMDLRTIADWQIRNRLLSIGGVSQVVVMGGDHKQYIIEADPEKMDHFGVSFQELLKACEHLNENATGSFLNDFGNEYVIRGIIRTNHLGDIGRSVIKVHNGQPISINDVALIKTGTSPKIGAGYLNSQPAVVMTILKQPNTNTLVLTEKIDAAIASLQENLPAHVKIRSDVFRQADFITRAVDNVIRALLEGGLFVAIILFLFLLNFRTTIISLIAIPLSLLVSVLTLKWLGLTINTMSLGGMAIAIGSLVDDAIIDVDNVLKRLKENARLPKQEQEAKLSVIFNASKEIRASILNATLIIIVAFIPLFFLSGMEGKMLKPLGISFIVSLFASLIVALTLTPVLCSYMLTSEKQLAGHKTGSRWVRWLNKQYGKALERSFKLKKSMLAAAGVLFMAAIFVFFSLGRSFLPEFNEGMLTLSTVSLPGISLDESNKMNLLLEKEMLEMEEINTVVRRTGRAELDEHAQGVFSSEIDIPFTLNGRSKEAFLEELRSRLATIRGINITIGQPLSHRIDHMLSGTRANIAIKVFGTDLHQMFSLSNQIKSVITNIDGLVDVNVEQQVEIPQLQIKPKREMLLQYGIPVNELAEFIDVAFAGEKVSEVYEGDRRFDLILRYNDRYRQSIESIKNTLIDTHDGKKIALKEVAEILSASGPNTIGRENVQRKVVVSANVSGRDLRGVVTDVQNAIEQNIQLPENYYIEYGGQFESEEKAAGLLFYTSMIAILIIFLLLYMEFRNVTVSAVILLNLPLALIGGVFSIWITSGMLSIPAIIGFITLFGIATRNGILLVSRFNALLEEGEPLRKAILHGALDRLNPILMTALTAALALIPLAIAGDRPGNEIQSPMAVVILGGLFSATLLNAFIVPAVYYLVKTKKDETSH
ncbi:efflux RND transporter permease subunit [Geofilum rubicundum]|uniref:Cobalt-zinc-cadmium resistance protein CzcA n=1 Tax=Geofilum rubicundum JCM 15548 TaxID=1236989 RepID=A0A0E9LWH4_9BACT|nr:efflux RND transporter permease subunit [Geofilum rubicundum]GAO29658.1 cobalt-zinc-cadmium resistance protein CzcA [Geofilum rubicundum JCM 15548]